MKHTVSRPLLVLFALAGLSILPARAAEQHTPEQAKALAIQAGEFLQAHMDNPQVAFDAFNSGQAPWRDGDLYVNVRRTDGVSMAHGMQPNMVGKNQIDLKDVDGKPIVREFIACTSPCWVDYKWKNYETKAVEAKTSYIVPIKEYRIIVGAYKK